jgi:VanZ family protein
LKSRYVLPALVWTFVVTLLTLMPGKDLPEINLINFDKFAHIGVFGLLNLLYLRWYRFGVEKGFEAWKVSLIVILYSGLIELLQGIFYVDRFADWADFAANTLGCILAWVLLPFLPKFLR